MEKESTLKRKDKDLKNINSSVLNKFSILFFKEEIFLI